MVSLIKIPPLNNTEKIYTTLAARINSLLFGSLKQNIFYLHIQKCGGISIAQAIKTCYYPYDFIKDRELVHFLDAKASFRAIKTTAEQSESSFETTDHYLENQELMFRERLLLYYMGQERIKYISGHFVFNEKTYELFSNKFNFVTVLRNPLERWISHYFWKRYNKNGHRNVDMDITEYLRSDIGQRNGYSYVKCFGGINKKGDYTSKQAIDKAKENLNKFKVVGCLEHQEAFVNQFEEQFGKKLKIRRLNQSPKSEAYRKSVVTEELKEEIKEICKPDIEIYQYALKNFVKT